MTGVLTAALDTHVFSDLLGTDKFVELSFSYSDVESSLVFRYACIHHEHHESFYSSPSNASFDA